ncbi:MAG: hypothetical protein WC840_05095 [Candidatus Peribacteraceae bacterium]
MPRHRDFSIGAPEADLTFRTDVYPLNNQRNAQLCDQIETLVDAKRCSINCTMGEIRITHLSCTYAVMVRFLLQNLRVLGGRCILQEVALVTSKEG